MIDLKYHYWPLILHIIGGTRLLELVTSSIESISKHYSRMLQARKKSVHERLGLKHPPLLDVKPENVVIDILHLMLRVTDILERNAMTVAVHQDRLMRRRGSKEHLERNLIPIMIR